MPAKPNKQTMVALKGRGHGVRQPTKALVLDEQQFKLARAAAARGEHALRNVAALNLSFYAGLRPCEIAGLEWDAHILDASGVVGQHIRLNKRIAKMGSGRMIPMHPDLRRSLVALHSMCPDFKFVFHPLKGDPVMNRVSANAASQFFRRLYADVGLQGCSAYSGRRTFITMRARQCNLVGASLRDVADLAGHLDINTTAGYVEPGVNVSDLTEMGLFHGAVKRRQAPALRRAA